MKRKIVILSLLLTVVTLLAVACAQPAPAPAPAPKPAPAPAPSPAPAPAPSPAPAPAQKITWVFAASSGAEPNVWLSQPYPRFQKMIEQATNGRLVLDTKVDLFPSTEVFNGIIGGRADIGFQRIPFVSGTFPLWDFGSFPFWYDSIYEYENTINDPRMLSILDKTYRDAGIVRLMEAPSAALDANFANKPIRTLEDWKGVKVRTAGLLPTLTLKQMGASPLTIPILEIADALQRGTVDAVNTAPAYGLGVGMTDVAKYINYWAVQSGYGGSIVVNLKSWNALPADLQQILRDVSKQMQSQVIFAMDSVVKVAKTGIAATKLQVIVPDKTEIDKARALCKPVIDEWLKVAGPNGPEVLAIAAQYGSGAKAVMGK